MKTKQSLASKLLKRPLTCLRVTGLSPDKFWELYKKFEPEWEKATQKQKSGRPYGLGEPFNHLFCLLVYYRTYTTHFFLGAVFNVDAATICRSIQRVEPLLTAISTLKKEQVMRAAELELLIKNAENEESVEAKAPVGEQTEAGSPAAPASQEAEETYQIVDATEQPIQRPVEGQRVYYSGKKKVHTVKTEVRSNQRKKIIHVSKPAPGSKHDFALYKEQTPVPCDIPSFFDSAYLGANKLLPQAHTPHKKKPGQNLSEEEICHNRLLGKKRVQIEHVIREMKVYQIFQQRHRNPLCSYANKTLIIAGLVNLKNGFGF